MKQILYFAALCLLFTCCKPDDDMPPVVDPPVDLHEVLKSGTWWYVGNDVYDNGVWDNGQRFFQDSATTYTFLDNSEGYEGATYLETQHFFDYELTEDSLNITRRDFPGVDRRGFTQLNKDSIFTTWTNNATQIIYKWARLD